jgi:hypothetical protein
LSLAVCVAAWDANPAIASSNAVVAQLNGAPISYAMAKRTAVAGNVSGVTKSMRVTIANSNQSEAASGQGQGAGR